MARILVVEQEVSGAVPGPLVEREKLVELSHNVTVITNSRRVLWEVLHTVTFDLCILDGAPLVVVKPWFARGVTWGDLYHMVKEKNLPTLVVMRPTTEFDTVYRLLAGCEEDLSLFQTFDPEKVCSVVEKIFEHGCVEMACAGF